MWTAFLVYVITRATPVAGLHAQPDNTTTRPATGEAVAAMEMENTRVQVAPPTPTKPLRGIRRRAPTVQIAMTLARNGKAVAGLLPAPV